MYFYLCVHINIYVYICVWRFPKIWVPPNHPKFHGIFPHLIPSILGYLHWKPLSIHRDEAQALLHVLWHFLAGLAVYFGSLSDAQVRASASTAATPATRAGWVAGKSLKMPGNRAKETC